MPDLTLVLPGLLASLDGLDPESVPRYPALEMILARAGCRVQEHDSLPRILCSEFGLAKQPGRDLPAASVTRLIDDAGRPRGIWMRADPVHIRVGMNGMTLMDPTRLALTQREAIVLGAPLKPLFAEYGWEFEVPVPDRWYLRLTRTPGVETRALADAIGREVHQFMAAGDDAVPWDRIHTEAQMLLHDSEVNREREQQGRMTVNSLWFWGAGELPDILPRRWSQAYSTDPLVRGLAMLSATPCADLPATAAAILHAEVPRDSLVVMQTLQPYSQHRDFPAWHESISRLENDWLAPLLAALREHRLARLTLSTDGHRYTVTGRSLLKFWRRPVPLPALARGAVS